MMVMRVVSKTDLLLKTSWGRLESRDVFGKVRSMCRSILGICHDVASESAGDVDHQWPKRFEKDGIAYVLSRAPESDGMLGKPQDRALARLFALRLGRPWNGPMRAHVRPLASQCGQSVEMGNVATAIHKT